MLTKEIQYRYDEWIKNVSEDLLHEIEKMDEKTKKNTTKITINKKSKQK